MMKSLFFPFAGILLVFAGCGESSNKTDAPVSAADSVKLQNKIYKESVADVAVSKKISEVLCQGWELDDDIEVIRSNNDAEGVYPFRSFYLSPDSTFVKNPRNYLEYGRWSYDDANKKITMKSSGGGKDEYKIAAIGPRELIVINTGVGSVTKLKFVSSGKKHLDKTQDPYYVENNRWRIKPRFSESDSLIRKRLKDCIRFYVLFYKDNLAKEENIISFYGFPTCLKWYEGGIFMVKEKDLADNWFECFYSREQAMKAYAMMEKVISKKYKWSKERMSWVKKNLLVLEQMYANL